ncbi:hypothetical protein ACC716_36400 [Rhizobium johnstonii]|uniref:hypothetical protein n=1 Tax=Rhizobium TaxID=379 RepID=UPI0013EF06B8|nr:hypothetical protein [Rhizobium leguminosarum]
MADSAGWRSMLVFSATLDLLCPDSLDLAAEVPVTGAPIKLHPLRSTQLKANAIAAD